jgi:hypothetical protein
MLCGMIGISRNNATARQPPRWTHPDSELTREPCWKSINPELT